MKILAIASALGFAVFVTCQGVQAQGSEALEIRPGDMKWGVSAALPKGAKIALIRGDPKQGSYVVRVIFPANCRFPPHTHPDEHTVTVISGTLYYAPGDKFDAKKLKAFPHGSFIVEPAEIPHYLATKRGPVTVQVTGTGATDSNYINPKDDPRTK